MSRTKGSKNRPKTNTNYSTQITEKQESIVKFLKEAETYYLATVEGDQPRVRLFGTAHIFE